MAGWRRKRRYRTDYVPQLPERFRRKHRQNQTHTLSRRLEAVRRWRRQIDLKQVAVWAFQIAVVVLIAFVCVWYFGVRVKCLDNSMNPQIRNQQSVLVNRVVYNTTRPKRGDIIVFKPRGNEKDRYYIRRIVGMPGEKLQIKDGSFYVNGKKLKARYISNNVADPGMASDEISIANDSYFVMSDNQYNMEDSRSSNIGNVKRSSVLGKAWFVPSISRQFGFIK